VSQQPPFGSSFGDPGGTPTGPAPAGEQPAPLPGGGGPVRPVGRAWWQRREVAAAAAVAGVAVVLGAVGLVVLRGGGDEIALSGGAARAAVPTATPTTKGAPTEAVTGSGGRNPFVGKAAVGGNTTGTPAVSTAEVAPVATVTKTVAGPVVTLVKATTKTSTVTATVTADPVYLYLRALTGSHGSADFTVNEDQVDGIAEGHTFSSGRFTFTGTTSATCLNVSYDGAVYPLCEGDVVKLG
jgi:hypothetical protein